jgi:glutamine synthetase
MTMDATDGGPSAFDPPHRLADIVSRYAALGLTPVVATELEFFLFDPLNMPPVPLSEGSHLYDMAQMDQFEQVLEDITEACRIQNLPSDVVIAESGLGQYEINFHHQPDALRAADCAVLFRRLVRGVARNHGLDATFMAKPFGHDVGSGMHVHASIIDDAGANIFADAANPNKLSYALGGLLTTMNELQLVFAPNQNSYRRFSKEGFAPTQINWGHDHRAASVRMPEITGKGARFEHRVSGADVNPYLAVAAILGGALRGLNEEIDPGLSIDEDADSSFGQLGWDWQSAIHRFEHSEIAADLFGQDFVRVFALMKQDELNQLLRMVTDVEYKTYLGRI